MNTALAALDKRLRTWVLAPCRIRCRWVLGLLTLFAFALLMYTRSLGQLTADMSRLPTVLLLSLPLATMLWLALRLCARSEGSTAQALCACILCGLGMLARLSFLERSAGDFDIYLSDWLSKLAAGSFSSGMRQNIGEYNVLYQYFLFFITRLPVPSLYAVKAVSFVGDALLAGAAARLCSEKGSLGVFGAALLLPTLVLNGGMFAQCDSLYAACALWGLLLSLEGKGARGAACFALSLAFKLQAAFLLPIVAVLWVDKKLQLRDALVFIAVLVLTALPAMLGGKSPAAILSVYIGQMGLYTGLNYNAPNFFALMNTAGLDSYAYGNFAMALSFGICVLLVLFYVHRAGTLDRGDYLYLALLLPLCIVFCLPRMHERYFYLADVLAIVLAAHDRRMLPAAVLAALASLAGYWELTITLPIAAGMMLVAIVVVWIGANKHAERLKSVL